MLVDIDGSLSLADFGAARCGVSPQDNIKTNLAGTLRYLSPEQIGDGGTAIDHRSDLYSIGATLFELVIMNPYIDGDCATDILTRIAYSAPLHANRVNPSVPTDLDAILCRATARDPQARYATASELADDLRQFLIGQQTATLAASQSKRSNQMIRRVRVGLAASVVAAIVGIGSLSYMAVQSSVAKVDLKNNLQSELANSYYRLGVTHGQRYDHPQQEKMLQQSIELWEKYRMVPQPTVAISSHPNKLSDINRAREIGQVIWIPDRNNRAGTEAFSRRWKRILRHKLQVMWTYRWVGERKFWGERVPIGLNE